MDFNIQIGDETPKDNFASSDQKVKIFQFRVLLVLLKYQTIHNHKNKTTLINHSLEEYVLFYPHLTIDNSLMSDNHKLFKD
jgi:hypothetical protein